MSRSLVAPGQTLTSARLTLRVPRPGDEDALFALHSDARVMRYFSEPPWTDRARAVQQIADDAAAFERADYFRFAIVLNDTASLIGNCTLFALHQQNRRAEIGYALGRDHWGRGYMNEALGALLKHAFLDLELNRIEADVDPRNDGSINCLRRLGFAREGLLRERWIVGGEVCDSALYRLLRGQWQQGPGQRGVF